jgi:hypothetical protein
MEIQKTGIKTPAAKTPIETPTQAVLKQYEKLQKQLVQALDPGSDGGLVITAPELARLRKGLAQAKDLPPAQRAQIEQALTEADAALKLNEVIGKIRSALDGASQGGKAITAPEALAIIQQAQGVPEAQLQQLKAQVLHALTAKDGWSCEPDAAAAFAQFLGVPVDKLPAQKATRSEHTAAFTKARNEALPHAIPRAEFKEIMSNLDKHAPPELRDMVHASMLGLQKEGRIKLDPDSRKLLTRAVAQSPDGLQSALAHRDFSDVGLARPGSPSYLSMLIASGASFEEVLFAFLLMLADKADKKAMQAMEDLARASEQKTGDVARPGEVVEGNGKDERVDTGSAGGTGAAGGTGTALGQGDVAKTSKVLESMVQSAHHMTTDTSEGGAQITINEAKKLVSYFERLPANVQKVMAGSLEKALQAGGVPLSGNAHFALDEWASKQLGRPLDVTPGANPGEPTPYNAELAKELRASSKLEDKIASFIVDTMYKPELSLKAKMAPFKSLRLDMATAGEQIKQVNTDQPLGRKVERARNAAAGLVEEANRREGKIASAPANASATAADEVKAESAVEAATATAASDASPAAQISNIVEGEPGGAAQAAGHKPSEVELQQRMQMAVNERQRVFDMLSNIMKAIHDMQMTAIRNLR